MNARIRPMALDGRSLDAAIEQTERRITAVQSAIMRVFRERGPMTLDALADAYAATPNLPAASPQSIRSRAAELKRRGILATTNIEGHSNYGRPATVLALASTAQEASCLF